MIKHISSARGEERFPLRAGVIATPFLAEALNDVLIARQVLAGQWGNGQERINRLTAAGYDAGAVQQAVDNIVYLDHLRSVATPEYMDVARQVLAGQWGNGAERKARLEAAGYNYNDIQGIVANFLH